MKPTHRNVKQEIPSVFGRSVEEIVEVKFPKRTHTYYAVTEAEIDSYAQFGWFSSISLTLFGTASGIAVGCIVALVQGNVPTTSQPTLIN